jgi:hypothetical protein
MCVIDNFSFDFFPEISLVVLERHLILDYQGQFERVVLTSSIIVGSDDNSLVLATELN